MSGRSTNCGLAWTPTRAGRSLVRPPRARALVAPAGAVALTVMTRRWSTWALSSPTWCTWRVGRWTAPPLGLLALMPNALTAAHGPTSTVLMWQQGHAAY